MKKLLQQFLSWLRFRNLPWTCQHCEVLWICRNPETGKCRHGCMTMNNGRTYTLDEVEQQLFGKKE